MPPPEQQIPSRAGSGSSRYWSQGAPALRSAVSTTSVWGGVASVSGSTSLPGNANRRSNGPPAPIPQHSLTSVRPHPARRAAYHPATMAGRRQMRTKVAFVLGGGGHLGAHEVGMLRALLEDGVLPDLVVGTSVGALNGAAV